MKMEHQRGFSLAGLLLVVALLALVVDYGYHIIPVYTVKGTIQNIFRSLATHHPDYTQEEVRRKLPEIMRVEYLDPEKDVPEEFFDNLVVVSEDGKMDISTEYQVEVWPLGMPEPFRDPDVDEEDVELSLFERLQLKARLVFDFEISAHTP